MGAEYVFIDKQGNVALNFAKILKKEISMDLYVLSVESFSEGIAEVSYQVELPVHGIHRRTSYINKEGEIIVTIDHEYAWKQGESFKNGLAEVAGYYIDYTGKRIKESWCHIESAGNITTEVVNPVD